MKIILQCPIKTHGLPITRIKTTRILSCMQLHCTGQYPPLRQSALETFQVLTTLKECFAQPWWLLELSPFLLQVAPWPPSFRTTITQMPSSKKRWWFLIKYTRNLSSPWICSSKLKSQWGMRASKTWTTCTNLWMHCHTSWGLKCLSTFTNKGTTTSFSFRTEIFPSFSGCVRCWSLRFIQRTSSFIRKMKL